MKYVYIVFMDIIGKGTQDETLQVFTSARKSLIYAKKLSMFGPQEAHRIPIWKKEIVQNPDDLGK